jgi:hypothetical protein
MTAIVRTLLPLGLEIQDPERSPESAGERPAPVLLATKENYLGAAPAAIPA